MTDLDSYKEKIFDDGKLVYKVPSIKERQATVRDGMGRLYPEIKRLENPQEYFVDLSMPLLKLKKEMIREHTYQNLKDKKLEKDM